MFARAAVLLALSLGAQGDKCPSSSNHDKNYCKSQHYNTGYWVGTEFRQGWDWDYVGDGRPGSCTCKRSYLSFQGQCKDMLYYSCKDAAHCHFHPDTGVCTECNADCSVLQSCWYAKKDTNINTNSYGKKCPDLKPVAAPTLSAVRKTVAAPAYVGAASGAASVGVAAAATQAGKMSLIIRVDNSLSTGDMVRLLASLLATVFGVGLVFILLHKNSNAGLEQYNPVCKGGCGPTTQTQIPETAQTTSNSADTTLHQSQVSQVAANTASPRQPPRLYQPPAAPANYPTQAATGRGRQQGNSHLNRI